MVSIDVTLPAGPERYALGCKMKMPIANWADRNEAWLDIAPSFSTYIRYRSVPPRNWPAVPQAAHGWKDKRGSDAQRDQ